MTTEEAEDRYLEALDAFESGDYTSARALLAPLRWREPGDEVRNETERLLGRMGVDRGQLAWAVVALALLLLTIAWTFL
jgi:hypothetical protein